MDKPEEVRIELKSQVGTSHDPATVRVYVGEKLISEVVASIEQQKGADGGLYPCVTLKEKAIPASATDDLSSLERFKLCVLSEEFTDEQVLKVCLDTEIAGTEDIEQITGILAKHRPEVLNMLKQKYPTLVAAQ